MKLIHFFFQLHKLKLVADSKLSAHLCALWKHFVYNHSRGGLETIEKKLILRRGPVNLKSTSPNSINARINPVKLITVYRVIINALPLNLVTTDNIIMRLQLCVRERKEHRNNDEFTPVFYFLTITITIITITIIVP